MGLLLKVILKISCDTFVQMYLVCAEHIVAVAGISEKVGLGTGIYTCTNEG